MKVRSKFSGRIGVIARFAQDGRTQKQFREKVDINSILKKYSRRDLKRRLEMTPDLPFADLSRGDQYLEDMNRVAKAQHAFEMLPSELRNKYGNSIPKFLDALKDPDNKQAFQRMGIFKPDVPPAAAGGSPAESPGGTKGPHDPLANKKTGKAKAPPKMDEGSDSDE